MSQLKIKSDYYHFLMFLINESLMLFFINGHNYWILTNIDKVLLCVPDPSTFTVQSG